MAVQHYTVAKIYPYVDFAASVEEVSALILGVDVFDALGCIMEFEVGDSMESFFGAKLVKKSETTYRAMGYSDRIVQCIGGQLPEDLANTLECMVDHSLCDSWRLIH
jgi:hypothetical protein